MTDLEKRAEEYLQAKWGTGEMLILGGDARKVLADFAQQETDRLSKHILELQADKGRLKEENNALKSKIGLSVDCDKAKKNGNLCLGYGGDEDEPCEQCKNCIKCETGYYQLGETEKDEHIVELQKENAELRSQLKHRNCVDCSNHGSNIKLLKAKDLLAKWVELYKPKSNTALPTPIQVVTEQFLKEQTNENN